jgi:predicted DNA-binding protein with PD1-like motif
MKYLRLGSGQGQTFVLVFDTGDEVVGEIKRFAQAEDVRAARLTGIGGFSQAELGYYRREILSYESIPITEQVELLSLIGNITVKDSEPLLHAHAVVGHRGGGTSGGHLIAATVWPTLELFVEVYSTELVKRQRPELGIATIDLE